MKYAVILVTALALAGCGASRDIPRNGQVTRLSTGPISKACLAADRKAASRTLCGCIQTVANQSLNGSDQRMAVSFFKDPHRAQEIRQSDSSRHESFWKRYRSFATDAERLCRGY